MSVIFGRHPVLEALKARVSIDKVLLQEGVRGDFEKELRHLCKECGVPMQIIPRERLYAVAPGNNQGVAAFQSAVDYLTLADVLPGIYERGENPLLVLLDSVTDVRNAGAIARTAEGMGAHALVVPMKGAAQFNADTVKASAGALSWLPVCRETSLHAAMEMLILSGVSIFAADSNGGAPVKEMDFTGPTALLFGAEGEGIQPPLLRLATRRFYIPMLGKVDSFNVSVAAGMALYEVARQR